MKFLNIFLFITLFVMHAGGMAMQLPEVIQDVTLPDQFKTVQLYPKGNALAAPVIPLNSDQRLLFSFDDLSNEVNNLYYTVFHCDRNWKLSTISQEEYLGAFPDYPLDDYAFSENTKVKYLNYQLELPNDDVPLKYSGNWALVVFDKDTPDEPLIIRRFYVVEPIVGVDARIRNNLFDVADGKKQEIDFVIQKNGLQFRNLRTDLKVVVCQNRRYDNALTDLKPMFDDEARLEYGFNSEANFLGGNEFRKFEFRTIKYPGENVADIRYHSPLYHITLQPDHIRAQERYAYNRELNGLYRVEMYDSDFPEVQADYMLVHFTLEMDQVLAGGGVYVFGALTNWHCEEKNRMKYDMETGKYELSLMLKQGFYTYCYAWKDFTTNKVNLGAIEGSYTQTENDYEIFVYYGQVTDRYDRLVGYGAFNSLTSRSYVR